MKYGIINIIALVCFRSAIFHLALPLSLCACTLIFSSYSNNHVWSFYAIVLVCVPQLLYRAQTHVPQNTIWAYKRSIWHYCEQLCVLHRARILLMYIVRSRRRRDGRGRARKRSNEWMSEWNWWWWQWMRVNGCFLDASHITIHLVHFPPFRMYVCM